MSSVNKLSLPTLSHNLSGAVPFSMLCCNCFCLGSQSVIVPNAEIIGVELKRLQPRPVYHLKLSDQALSKRPSVQMPC